MADAFIDVELVEDISLPYESGAEQWLDGWLALAWQQVANNFVGLRLDPLFSSVDAATLADLVDVARMLGEEPPDPFAWFEIPCDEALVEDLLPLIEALPFVLWAGERQLGIPAGIVSFGTNPEAHVAMQLSAQPFGVDAIYAWQVPGGTAPRIRVSDIEHGWNLNHEDLVSAEITRFSTFGSSRVDHGTGVLGILMAADNGVGLVGIAPEATGFLVTEIRATGKASLPAAFAAAGIAARPGGVVLLELALSFVRRGNDPDILVEIKRPDQVAIRLLTAAGINVVEPAGNRGTNLDQFPFLAQVQPGSPTFVDSGAIVVGGADPQGLDSGDFAWSRGSTYGARVDCFAAFDKIRSPAASAVDAYQYFTGTSGASAIVAGVVCAIQGMVQASTNGLWLRPADIRRLLRDPALGTPTGPGQPAGIGSMPDLRKIALHMGWRRILPLAVMPIANDGAIIIQIDDGNHLSRRSWALLTGLLPNLPLPSPDDGYELSGHTPAVIVTLELAPLLRTVFEVVAVGNDGSVYYVWWDTLGYTGQLTPPRSAENVVAAGHDVSAVHPTISILAVAGISPEGRLVFMIEDASLLGVEGLTDPLVLDPVATYRILSGPVLISRLPGKVDLVAIDDGGNLRWAAGNVLATIGTGWDPFVAAQGDVPLNPRAKPGVIGTFDGVAVIAVGIDGLLYSCGFGLQPIMFETLVPIDNNTQFAARGPVALALTNGDTLVAAAVGADGLLYTGFRRLTVGGTWSALTPIDRDVKVSPLGGATIVTYGAAIMVFAVLPDGRPCRSDFIAGLGWLPLRIG